MQKLLTGAAYHGNRMLHHAQNDMRDMADNHMNLVVHMFSHTDWDRHSRVMKDMVEISKEAGLEVWVDNWGLGGPPGDKSFFLAIHPEAHQIYSDGELRKYFKQLFRRKSLPGSRNFKSGFCAYLGLRT